MRWTHARLKPKRAKEQQVFKKDLLLQEKIDGWRITFFRQHNGSIVSALRDDAPDLDVGKKLEACGLMEAVRQVLPMSQSSMDCELITGSGREDVATALASGGNLQLRVFALPWWMGKNLMYEEPLEHITRISEAIRGYPELMTNIKGVYLTRDTEAEELLDWAKQAKLEGFVLKKYAYHDWWKVVVEKTVVMRILSLKDAKPGKFEGLVGSVGVGFEGDTKPVAYAGGFDYGTRFEIDESWIGKLIEVKYQRIGRGGLLHPRFKRLVLDRTQADVQCDS